MFGCKLPPSAKVCNTLQCQPASQVALCKRLQAKEQGEAVVSRLGPHILFLQAAFAASTFSQGDLVKFMLVRCVGCASMRAMQGHGAQQGATME